MYLILGFARTGLSTAQFLHAREIDFAVWDGDPLRLNKAESLGYRIFESDLTESITHIVVSPGIPLSDPIFDLFKGKDMSILTDTLLFQQFTQSQAKFIGVTGTNGKSTTTALLTHTLREQGIKAYMGGNIGIPVFDLPLDGEVYVLELSSFQLERAAPHKLDVACWINFSSDHLKEHGTLENYFAAKQKIFHNARIKIFGIDDDYPNKWQGDAINVHLNDPEFKDYAHPYLKGQHNLQNILMTFHILKNLGLSKDQIIKGMETFKGLSHRQQYLGKKDCVRFINDSKATSAAAAQTALEAYDNNYWILGGKAKVGGIESLTPYFTKIIKAYTFGESSQEFAQYLSHHGVQVEISETLDQAFEKAYSAAKKESKDVNLLFSPACASFDQYKDFEERGEHFIRLVQRLFEDDGKAPLLKAAQS